MPSFELSGEGWVGIGGQLSMQHPDPSKFQPQQGSAFWGDKAGGISVNKAAPRPGAWAAAPCRGEGRGQQRRGRWQARWPARRHSPPPAVPQAGGGGEKVPPPTQRRGIVRQRSVQMEDLEHARTRTRTCAQTHTRNHARTHESTCKPITAQNHTSLSIRSQHTLGPRAARAPAPRPEGTP